jgi:hypothetical protein
MKGGVCIFVCNNLKFIKIDLNKFSNDQDIEACAVKLPHTIYYNCILSVYRASTGNFTHFLDKLETILNLFHNTNIHIIICGHININYLVGN